MAGGLVLRGGIWQIRKTIRAGEASVLVRESTGCTSRADAERILIQRERETIRALLDGQTGRERCFAEAAVEYLHHIERRGKSPVRALQDIRMLIAEAGIEHAPLSHLHQRTLQPWIDRQRGKRASGTVARALRTLTAVLNHAARVLRDGNQAWLRGAVPRLIAPDWGCRQPHPLTWAEQDALVAELPEHLVPPVLFAVSTGARQEEICSLRWTQHRPVEGLPEWAVWWIPPGVRKANARKIASLQAGRYLIANALARSVVASQPRAEFVFPSPRGGRIDRLTNHGWLTARRKSGLESVRIHDLRHTYGERLATAGVPFDSRKTLLGHDHADITAHYSTPGFARLLAEAERVCRAVPTLRVAQNRSQ